MFTHDDIHVYIKMCPLDPILINCIVIQMNGNNGVENWKVSFPVGTVLSASGAAFSPFIISGELLIFI